jgi:transketolase
VEQPPNVVASSQSLAKSARIETLKMIHKAKASHVGSCLSILDVLCVLYSGAARINPSNTTNDNRDVVIVSKGHASAALYSVLSLREFFPLEWLSRYCENGAELSGHVTHKYVPGVELSTGSLGHGLPYGLGVQLSKKLYKCDGRTIVLMSDGECDEGTTWESALLASHHRLDKLIVVIDRNRIQSMGDTEETLALEPLSEKWEAFGWHTLVVDGHNHNEILEALSVHKEGKPVCIIANTTKGKGVSFMEGKVLWHYRPPDDDELTAALCELNS